MITFKNGIAYQEGKPIVLVVSWIKALPGYKLEAKFPDGAIKTYDFKHLLEYEAFKPLKDEEEFKKVVLENGVPTWEDANVDISPETIYINGE